LKNIPTAPLFTLYVNHGEGDSASGLTKESLTALKATKDSKYMVTADTKGQIKCWDLRRIELWNHNISNQQKKDSLIEVWFIHAHRKIINSLQICETFNSDIFIISASNDKNILIHRMSSGTLVGQLQRDRWDIKDMAPHDKKRPKYVQSWFDARRRKFQDYIERKKEAMRTDHKFKAMKESIADEIKQQPFREKYMTEN
jgi:WD40 repeat protein